MSPSNLSVGVSIPAFLGTLALIGLLGALALWWAVRGVGRQARLAGLGALGSGVTYLAVLIVASLVSHERVIPIGAEKYFCELDCHLAYSVTEVTPIAGESANGRIWAVTVQTRFDETTISARRPGDAALTPSPRRLQLRTAKGGLIAALTPEQLTASGIQDSTTPMHQALRPAESYLTTAWFRLPPDTRPDGLLLEDDVTVSRFLIGNERSPLHAKTFLALPEPLAAR